MSKRRDTLYFIVFLAFFIIINGLLFATHSLKPDKAGFGTMVAAGFTIALYSFLYEDNPLFKAAEHFFVGTGTAYIVSTYWYNNILRDVIFGLQDLAKEPRTATVIWQMVAIILPTILGLLVYTRLNRKIEWISRIPFSYTIGFSAGVAVPLLIQANILYQLKYTLVPLWTSNSLLASVNAIMIFVGVLCTLIYFFFSLEHKGVVGGVARLGVWFLMLSFGASFGYTVMGRISLLLERVRFLFDAWIPLISWAEKHLLT